MTPEDTKYWLNQGEPRTDALAQIASLLSTMFVSSRAHVRGPDDEVVGYTVQNGALHKIVGILAGLGHRVIIPASLPTAHEHISGMLLSTKKADERGSAEPAAGRKYLQLRTFLVQADPKALERFDELCKQVATAGADHCKHCGAHESGPHYAHCRDYKSPDFWRGSAEPIYQVYEDNAWRDTGWDDYAQSADDERRIVYTHPASAEARDAAQAVELTEAEIENCIDAANRKYNNHRSSGARGQTVTPSDDWKHWLAREIERAVLAKNGLGGKHGE